MPKQSKPARRKYSLSFKKKVYDEAYESPGKVRETARKYDVTPSTIRGWKNTLHRLDVMPERDRPTFNHIGLREVIPEEDSDAEATQTAGCLPTI